MRRRRRERQPGSVEPGVFHGHSVHHAAHVAVGQPDRPVHGVHEPAAVVIAGHRRADGRRDHAAAAPGAHRGDRHRRWWGRGRRRLEALRRQGRQRVRRQFQRQRVQHGRAEDAGVQQAQEG